MKKIFTLVQLFVSLVCFAQAPQGFNYQATVRNASGALIVNQNVNFKFNFMLNTATSVPVFSETHFVPTDDLGQINLVIGQGTATTGAFSTINWGTGNYYLGIELNTGSGYVAMGTTQLLSVPYALYANSSGNSATETPNLASVLAVNTSANNLQIKNLADPTEAQDAVTLSYLEAQNTVLQNQITALQNQITSLQSGSVTSLNCSESSVSALLFQGQISNNVMVSIPYNGGNGATYVGQSIISTGVTGLTATLAPGTFNYGNGVLSLTITGTPSAIGNANFEISCGGQTCTFTLLVENSELPKLAVPGDHQGWEPSTAPRIASSSSLTTDYQGYMWLNNQYKFLAPDSTGTFVWGSTNWGVNETASGSLLQNGDNCTVSAPGYYFVNANTSSTNYSTVLVSFGIIGEATPTGWFSDTDFTYNSTTKKLEIQSIYLTPGLFMFRGNDSWNNEFNYGSLTSEGYLTTNGNLNFTGSAGYYKVILDLTNPRKYTYSIIAN